MTGGWSSKNHRHSDLTEGQVHVDLQQDVGLQANCNQPTHSCDWLLVSLLQLRISWKPMNGLEWKSFYSVQPTGLVGLNRGSFHPEVQDVQVSQHWHTYSCKSPSCSTVQPFSGSTALSSDLLTRSILSSVFHLSSHRTASLELPQTRNSDYTMFIDPSNSWITLSNLAFSLIISNHPQITFLCVCKLSSHISLCCKLALAAALMTWGTASQLKGCLQPLCPRFRHSCRLLCPGESWYCLASMPIIPSTS